MPARARRSTDHLSIAVPSNATDPLDRRGEAGDDVEDRRLARAVRADEPDDLAGLDREAHAVDRDDAAELHDEVGHGERRRRPAAAPRGDGHVGDRARNAQPFDDPVQTGDACFRVREPARLERGDAVGRLAQHRDRAETRQHGEPRDDVGARRHDLLEDDAAERGGRAGRGDAAPDTHAMPPTTAYWISSTEPNTLYCVNCTFVWRIDSSTPPSAAIAAATANAYTFAAMTLTPSDAAARSLLRTASRRAPTRPRRRFATSRPTITRTTSTNAP